MAEKPAEATTATLQKIPAVSNRKAPKPPVSTTEVATISPPPATLTDESTAGTTLHQPVAVRQPSSPRDCPALFFIAFPIGSETPLTQNLYPKIKRLRSWLRQHPDKKVLVEGHTDSYGPEEFNLLLSYRRAKAAEKILLEAGIAGKQLLVRALGEEEPVPGLSAKSRKNRVASIRVEAPRQCINNLINGDID